MNGFVNMNEEHVKKAWVKPELEVLSIRNTEYWKFDDSGDFPISVWVDES